MKWVCTNCGHRFETEDINVRCPGCLRRNGIILEEEERRKSGGNAGCPAARRRLVWGLAAGALALSVAVAGLVWLLVGGARPSTSRYAKAPENFAAAAARVRESVGLELDETEDPFAAPAAVGRLVKAWGGTGDAVFERLQAAAKAGLNLGAPAALRLPGALAEALATAGSPPGDKPVSATPLEWALLGHALGVRLRLPVGLAVLELPEGTPAHPWGLGLYATVLHTQGFDAPPSRVITFGPGATGGAPAGVSPRVLSGAEVLAAVLSQAAWGRIPCLARPLELVLPRDAPRAASDEDARFASERLQAATVLAPELAPVKAAAVWGHVCLGMHRKARTLAEALVSEYEMKRQKAAGQAFASPVDVRRLYGFSALLQFVDGSPSGAADLIAKADAEFAPLAVPAAIGAQDKDRLSAARAALPASELPEVRYLKAVAAVMLREKAVMEAAVPEAAALCAALPAAKWAQQLHFTLLLGAGRFDEARARIPHVISGAPDAASLTEELKRVVDATEAQAKADEAAKASTDATPVPPDPMK